MGRSDELVIGDAAASGLRLVLVSRGESSFNFRCPFCREKLHLGQVAFRDVVLCPVTECSRSFCVATKKQAKAFRKAERARQRAEEREIGQLRKSGAVPADRISVFGVSSAGKSVFMAALYRYLWRGDTYLSARAERGEDHEQLLSDYAMLSRGEWLDATTRTRSMDLTLHFDGIRAVLNSVDYPGEVFTDVFYRKRVETQEQQQLYDQLQATMAAIILIDPQQVEGGAEGQRLDVEFTGIEVAEHLESRGIGDRVVIVLTKRNQNRHIVDRYGGPGKFIAHCLPQLKRAVPGARVVHLSSIGTRLDEDGVRRPAAERFDGSQVAFPLTHVLKRIPRAHLALLEQLDREGQQAANDAEDELRRNGAALPQSGEREVEGGVSE